MSDRERAYEQLDVLREEWARATRWFERTAQALRSSQATCEEAAAAACEGQAAGLDADVGVLRGKLYYIKKHVAWLEQQGERARALRL